MKEWANLFLLLFLLSCGALAVCSHVQATPADIRSAHYWLIYVVPPTLCIIALWSCLLADKASKRKMAWAAIVLLVPVLGPALWFTWGKKYS
jgi:hypothetical protein